MRQDRRLRIGNGCKGASTGTLTKLLHFFVFTLDGIIARACTSITLWLCLASVVTARSSTRLPIHRLAHAIESLLQRLTGRFDAADVVGGKGSANIGDLGLQFALLLRGELIAQFGETLLGTIGRAIG